MSNISRLGLVLLCASIIAIVGCRSKEAPAPVSKSSEGPLLAPPQQLSSPTAPQADHAALPAEGDPAASAAADESKEDAKIKANLASLSTSDRAVAEKQKICPVSGEKLGVMGTPKKVSVAGHDVFICCPSCADPIQKDPAKFLAKIGLEPAK